MIINLYYHVAFTLAPLLEHREESRRPFTATCIGLRKLAKCLPAAAVMLRGLQALSKQLNVQLPQESLACFADLGSFKQSSEDIPVAWAIPKHADLLESVSDDGVGSEQSSIELGKVIAKYDEMTLVG